MKPNKALEQSANLPDVDITINKGKSKQNFVSKKFASLKNKFSIEKKNHSIRKKKQNDKMFQSNEIIQSNNGLLYFDNEIFKDSRVLLDRANIIYSQVTNSRNHYRYTFEN